MNSSRTHHLTLFYIESPVAPVIVTRDLESQKAEEGSSVTLHCEFSKPGIPVEWKKGPQVLSCGEKYQMKQSGFTYELQIFDLAPGDTGNYSCCSEDTISSGSLAVNGRIEIMSYSCILLVIFFHHYPWTVYFSLSGYFFPTISCPSYIYKRARKLDGWWGRQCHPALWAF